MEKTMIIKQFTEAIDRHCKDTEEVNKVINAIYEVFEFITSQKNHSQDIFLDLRHAKNIVAEYSDQKSLEAVQTASDELIACMALSKTFEREIDIFCDIYCELNT